MRDPTINDNSISKMHTLFLGIRGCGYDIEYKSFIDWKSTWLLHRILSENKDQTHVSDSAHKVNKRKEEKEVRKESSILLGGR